MIADSHSKKILVVDDDADDQLMIKDAFLKSDESVEIDFVEDGEKVFEYLNAKLQEPEATRRMPSLIMMDLNMPKKDGREALRDLKGHPVFKQLPVIVFTTSKSERDILESYALGCNCYITKPPTYNGLVEVISSISLFWLKTVDLQTDII